MFGHHEGGGSAIISGTISGSTEVLPGSAPHRARLVPEIVPEIVPDPPLHSAQIILAFGKKDFYVF